MIQWTRIGEEKEREECWDRLLVLPEKRVINQRKFAPELEKV